MEKDGTDATRVASDESTSSGYGYTLSDLGFTGTTTKTFCLRGMELGESTLSVQVSADFLHHPGCLTESYRPSPVHRHRPKEHLRSLPAGTGDRPDHRPAHQRQEDVSGAPRLVADQEHRLLTGNAVAIVSRNKIRIYDFVQDEGQTTLQPRVVGQGTLTQNGYTFTETTPDGLRKIFDASGNLSQTLDAYGNLTNWNYNTDGSLAGATWTIGSITNTFTYSYTSGGILSGILRSSNDGQTTASVQSSQYEYYADGDVHGMAGNLKLVRSYNGTTTLTGTDYYRNYTTGESLGTAGSLKLVLGPSAFARVPRMDSTP